MTYCYHDTVACHKQKLSSLKRDESYIVSSASESNLHFISHLPLFSFRIERLFMPTSQICFFILAENIITSLFTAYDGEYKWREYMTVFRIK